MEGNIGDVDQRIGLEGDRATPAGGFGRAEEQDWQVVEGIPAILYRVSIAPHATLVYISPQVEQLLGFSPAEWQADPGLWARLVDPRDLPGLLVERERALAAGDTLDAQYRLYARDGRLLWFRDRACFRWDPGGRVGCMHGVMIEITPQVQAEEALRESERKYRGIVENMGDGVAVVGVDGRVSEWNPGLERITGWSRAEVLGRPIWDVQLQLVPETQRAPELRERFQAMANHLIRNGPDPGAGVVYETPVQHRDGSLRVLEQRYFPIETPLGWRVCSIIHDITGYKRTEEAIRKLNAEMELHIQERTAQLAETVRRLELEIAQRQAVEERYRVVSELTSDFAYALRVEADGRFVLEWITEAFTRVLGWEASEFNASRSWGEFILPEDLPAVLAHGARVLAGIEDVAEFRVPDRSGRRLWLRNYSRPVWDTRQGRVVRVFGACQEITATKEAQQRSQRSAARTEALARVAARLNASLDLQTVLAAVCEEAAQALGLPAASIMLYAEAQRELVLAAGYGHPAEMLERFAPLPIHLFEPILEQAAPIVIPDVLALPDFPNQALFQEYAIRTIAFTLLRYEGELVGCLEVNPFGEPGTLHPEELDLLQAFAEQAGAAIANARLFDQVQRGRQRLEDLSGRLLAVQEAERRALAHELHDQIGQVLTGLQFSLETAKRAPEAALRAGLQEAQALVGDLIAQVRALSLDLRPAMLDDLGLLPAIEWHLGRYTVQTGIQVEFVHAGLEAQRFPPEIETAAFRLIQEALTNVARHSGADRAALELRAGEDRLALRVQDWGRGFEMPEPGFSGERSLGLAGMRERAELLGGELQVQAAPGQGVQVSACLPLRGPIERRRGRRSLKKGASGDLFTKRAQ